jgi:uncharacterized repeat protein (TIGR01451 family)
MTRLILRVALAAVCAASLASACVTPTASATSASPGLTIESYARPTNFSVGSEGFYQVTVRNAGSVATDGSPITLADALPPGLTIKHVALYFLPHEPGESEEGGDLGSFFCEQATATCHFPAALAPGQELEMVVHVAVEANAPETLTNSAEAFGGGAARVLTHATNVVSPAAALFGPSSFDFGVAGLDGAPDTQAADHPYELTVTIALNTDAGSTQAGGGPESQTIQNAKNIIVDLPLGFVGSTLAAPECTFAELSGEHCPADTIVGFLRTEPIGATGINSPIYNLVPQRGFPAEFGYVDVLKGSHVLETRVVPTASGYVLQTTSPDTPQIALRRIVATFYGDPALRDAATVCGSGAEAREITCREGLEASQIPFFTNPTDCSGQAPTATLYVDSWQNPAKLNAEGTPVNLEEPQWKTMSSQSPPMTGCNTLSFTPEVLAQPTTHESDKPSGLDMDIKQPQTETVGVPATPTLKKAVVSFPEGFTVDPSAGQGLQACSEAQIGWVGPSHLNFNAAAPSCPEASKIGILELETPLVPHKLEGEMFLAAQNENPFGSTLGLYVVVNDPVTGVLIKLAGKAVADEHTGRMSAEFDENPNLPFSDLKLHFFGGPRAEFATPESCGTFTTTTALTPYSAPDSGLAATPFDSFPINEACPGGFAPTFTAGSTNVQAGAYTPFDASFSRSDTDQELSGLSLTLPPGLSGKLAGIPECPEAQANAGTCPESSLVGTVKAGAGPGPNPLFVTGKAYLTGPYNNGPFGLSVVVPAVAGPFNFGTVVVRQSIRINPLTAQVTDVSDPFPKIIDGIPLRLRRIDVELNRPNFIFNPSSCEHMGFSGTISGSPLGAPTELHGTVGYATQAGSTASLSAPFQVTDCQALKFTPSFKPTVTGKTSKADGAGLSVKLSYPANSIGTQANIARVKVELPKALPSRLTTLQQACLAATFEANPASCPTHSLVGHAKVATPLLTDPLEGPVYFVSHGAEQFPNLTIVLKGDGVSVQLIGQTFISKSGITSTTFKATPDVPFNSFELTLPQGPYSALAANANLCETAALAMPSEFIAQNGAELKQSTPIEVSGCSTKLALISHKRKGQKLTLSVYAPAAGKVKVSGKGIRSTSKSAKGRELISLSVPLTRKGHFKAKLKLSFTPSEAPHRTEGLTLGLRT